MNLAVLHPEAERWLSPHVDATHALCQKYGVVRLKLFGSALGHDKNPDSSDFDFAAEFGPPRDGVNLFEQQFGLVADLEQLLGRAVDVVDWTAARKPRFRQWVESQAKELYAA